MSSQRPFHLIILDETKKRFAVLGPLIDDSDINNRVVLAQQQGRAIRCWTSGVNLAQAVADQRALGRSQCTLHELEI